jgi:RNA polymerase sigma-70 factor (ECF subfamily)
VRSVPPIDCELLMLDSVLQELALIDPRQARIVEMKYFAGLSEEEVAAILSLSRTTVTREWQSARAWLFRRLTTGRTADA